MIYVTAGGGYVGREIVERLVKAGQRVRALVTIPEEGQAIEGPNVETVVGDRARPETFAPTLAGADAAMLFTRNARDLVAKDASFCENMLWFVDEIRASGAFSLPMGNGRVGMIDYRDIADVAVKCLTQTGHEGRSYQLSGPELLSCADIATKLSRVTGIPIRFNDMPPDEFRKLLRSMGRPAWHAEEMTVSYLGMSKGASAVLTEEVQRVLGRPATPFDRVAADYARLFPGAVGQ